MYKIKWDKETSGILLSDSTEDTIIPPRPVYFEELDLLINIGIILSVKNPSFGI